MIETGSATWGMLAGAVFAGGMMDAVAGGGGVITVPAFLAVGLPPVEALGTNKLVAVTGSLTSVLRYARAHLVPKAAVGLALCTFLGSVLGAWTAVSIPVQVLKPLLVALAIAALGAVLWHQNRWRDGRVREPRDPRLLLYASLGLGFYDGFFGPGTGTFCLAALAALGGFGLAEASGGAKLLNFGSNLGAVLLFSSYGEPQVPLALTLIPFMMAGSWAGAELAVRHGAGFIRSCLVLAAVALCVKLGWGLLG